MSNYNPEDIKLASVMTCSNAKMTAHCSECRDILSQDALLFIFDNMKGPSVTKRLEIENPCDSESIIVWRGEKSNLLCHWMNTFIETYWPITYLIMNLLHFCLCSKVLRGPWYACQRSEGRTQFNLQVWGDICLHRSQCACGINNTHMPGGRHLERIPASMYRY